MSLTWNIAEECKFNWINNLFLQILLYKLNKWINISFPVLYMTYDSNAGSFISNYSHICVQSAIMVFILCKRWVTDLTKIVWYIIFWVRIGYVTMLGQRHSSEGSTFHVLFNALTCRTVVFYPISPLFFFFFYIWLSTLFF